MKIVHLPKIAAGRCKNTKLTGNASQLAIELISNDNDIGIELYGKAMIKANWRLFKTAAAATKYVKTFTFGENCLSVQIERIENSKMKIVTRLTVYAKLATKFLKNGSWRENK